MSTLTIAQQYTAVIPAEAGLSTAELVIHLACVVTVKIKLDSRFRGNDGNCKTSIKASIQHRAAESQCICGFLDKYRSP